MRRQPPAKNELEAIETASCDELTALQTERIKWTLGYAYDNVAAYREKFEKAGVHPDDFHQLADLANFPFTTKDDLREAYPFGMFAVPREQLVRIHASSGTTGKPTVVGYTRGDLDTWTALIARSLRAAGARAGDIVHNAFGYGLFTGGLGVHYGAEALGCTTVPVSGGLTQRQVQLIEDFGPVIIAVTPSYLLAIADEFDRQGLDSRKTSLRIGFHGAEPWTEAMREQIEERFDIDALNHYGLSEIQGPGVATECIETKDGLTLWEDHFYPEIIDPDTAAILPDEQIGELVLTTLTKEGLPMIRYRTRDLTRLLPPTARSMRRIDRITGRSDDMLIIHGVNVFPTTIEALILEHDTLSPHYVLERRTRNHLDELTVVVEACAELSASGEAAMVTAGDALQQHIKAMIGINTMVKVVLKGSVERSVGKAKRVIDLRQ
ncbi:MAG: phenylacetate--CoA ligase [Gammaproteobacteria bacterium]|nr:phenylacetate--CoA ligase [Gammaproteobacteria bacterium]